MRSSSIVANNEKHIFLIHSNITAVMAFSIINYLKINYEDVVFLYKRIKGFEVDIKSYNIDELIKIKAEHNKIERYRKINQIDKLITDLIGPCSRFNLYLPNYHEVFTHILASNKRCKTVNFMEEGAVTLQEPSIRYALHVKLSFLQRLGWFLRVEKGISYFPKDKEADYYALSQDAFTDVESRFIIPVYKPNFINTMSIEAGSVFFLPDSILENKAVSIDYFVTRIEKFIFWLNNNSLKKVYLKFHPVQAQYVKDLIVNKLNENNIDVVLVKEDQILEYVFANTKQLKIVGFISSLLVYGVMNNHDVYTLTKADDELGKQINSFSKIMKNIQLMD
jgi:hypothetical protein